MKKVLSIFILLSVVTSTFFTPQSKTWIIENNVPIFEDINKSDNSKHPIALAFSELSIESEESESKKDINNFKDYYQNNYALNNKIKNTFTLNNHYSQLNYQNAIPVYLKNRVIII